MLLWDSVTWALVIPSMRLCAALLLLGTTCSGAVFQSQPKILQYEEGSPPGSGSNHDKETFWTPSISSHVSQASGTESEGYSYENFKGYAFSNPLHLIVSYVDSGHYHCTGIFKSPGPGAKKAAAVVLRVQELFPPPTIIATPSTKPQEGSQMTLSCETKLSPQRSNSLLHFSFYKDGSMVQSKDRSPIYTLLKVQLGDSGSYWCEAVMEDGQIRKQSLRLEVQVQNFSSKSPPRASASTTSDPSPKKTATPKPAPSDPLRPSQSSHPSSGSPCSDPPLKMQDPFLSYQMHTLLRHMQNVRTLLGHLVLELRDLSGRLESKASGVKGSAPKAHKASETSRGPQRK